MGGLDLFVLLTPVLVLGVLALLAFVGCDPIYWPPYNWPTFPPPEFHGLTATPGAGVVFLSWQIDLLGADYEMFVRRATTQGGPYDQIFQLLPELGDIHGVKTFRFADGNVQIGVRHFYIVKADYSPDDSKNPSSNEAFATPVLPFVTSETLGTTRQDSSGFGGMAILVGGNPLTVYALGRIVAPGNADTHLVKLVDAATNMDVPGSNVTVSTAGGNVGDFVYTDLPSPVTLNANATYYILSRETPGVDSWYNLDTTVTSVDVARVTGAVSGDGVSMPPYAVDKMSDASGNYTYGPVNFKYFGFDRGP